MNLMRMYSLIPITDPVEWEKALARAGSFDTYHLPEYHLIAKEMGEGEPYLFLFQHGYDYAALPFLLRSVSEVQGLENSTLFDATSVYGYPGIVTSIKEDSTGAKDFRSAFQAALDKCFAELSVVAFFTRTNPLFDNSWLLEGKGEIVRLSSTVAIDLTKPEAVQLEGMSKGHRCDIRKAYRQGVTVVEDVAFENLAGFISAYNETMRRVGAREYYFFNESYYRKLKSALGESLRLFLACSGDRIISASLFLVTGEIIQYHLSGTFSDCVACHGAKAIIDAVREWGSARHYSWLHLGGGVGSSEDNLYRFKAGFSRVRLPFKVIRTIVDEVAYQKLCRKRRGWLALNGHNLQTTGFFPEYRTPLGAECK